MAWFKVDDGFWAHPKTVGLSGDAIALWVRGGTWSAQQLTDGFIPSKVLPILQAVPESAAELVGAGLWDVLPDGWGVHDWERYQPSRTEVEEKRKSVSEKRSEAGKKGAQARWGDGKNGKRDGKPMANAWQTDGPVPSRPVPTPDTPVVTGHLSVRNARETIDDHSQLAGFFKAKHIDPDAVAAMIQDRLGIQLNAQGVFHLFSDLQMDAKATIANGQAYIRTALKETPERVEKLIYERGDAA